EMAGKVAFDSRQHSLHFGEIKGVFSIPCGANYGWILQPSVFTQKENQWEGVLDGSLYEERLELFRLVGQLRFSPTSCTFNVCPDHTHLLGCPIEKGKGS